MIIRRKEEKIARAAGIVPHREGVGNSLRAVFFFVFDSFASIETAVRIRLVCVWGSGDRESVEGGKYFVENILLSIFQAKSM